MTEQSYSIGELAAAAGTTPRTIRYYTAEGLLPPPELHGRYGQYRREHLLRLQVITRLKQAFLPLHVIRARIEGASEAALEQELAAEDHAHQRASPPHAAPISTPQRIAETPQRYDTASAPLAYGFAPPPSMAIMPGAPNQDQRFSQPAAPSFTPHPPLAHGEPWQRLVLASGIELHVREPASAEQRAQIERLLAAARQIFS